MKQKTAIIIGAGIGGLATAIQLAKNGYKISVYEKNSKPGGRCHQIIRDGHVFDTGPTMFIFPEIYTRFFTSIGEDIHSHVTLIPADPIYQLNFSDNTQLLLTTDPIQMEQQLESLELGSYQRFVAYQQLAKRHYDITLNQILACSFNNPFDYFKINPFCLIGSHALVNHVDVVKKLFKHPHLQTAFTFQDSYLSLHPFESPSIYSSFSFTEFTHGNFLPQGGMYQVILALEKIANKVGVKIYYNSEVNKINISNNYASGITLQNKHTESADVVVVDAELPYAYDQLLPPSRYSKKLHRKQYSCSAIIFHWGLDKQYPQLQTHNLFFSNDYREGFDQVINHSTPPTHPHFYIQAPVRIDPTRAPENQDTISVMIPINHLYPDHPINWQQYQTKVRNYVITRLHQAGLTDIEKHIKFEESYLPSDWEHHLNLPYGAIYGLHHNMTQLGPFRPKRNHAMYKNVYFVGASTHPGSGLPTVLMSSQFAAQQILSRIT